VEALILGKDGAMPTSKRYPDEIRQRAVRMVFEIREQTGKRQGAIARVGERLR
jgi:transposase